VGGGIGGAGTPSQTLGGLRNHNDPSLKAPQRLNGWEPAVSSRTIRLCIAMLLEINNGPWLRLSLLCLYSAHSGRHLCF
jgi:hypothetical protein